MENPPLVITTLNGAVPVVGVTEIEPLVCPKH